MQAENDTRPDGGLTDRRLQGMDGVKCMSFSLKFTLHTLFDI